MQLGMSNLDIAELKLKQRIRWSCLLHVVRDTTGEHELQLMDEFLLSEVDPNGEMYGRLYGLFEATHKYCKKVMKDGLEVCCPPPSPPSPLHPNSLPLSLALILTISIGVCQTFSRTARESSHQYHCSCEAASYTMCCT